MDREAETFKHCPDSRERRSTTSCLLPAPSQVSQLGVHCFHAPRGVTRGLFERGLAAALAGQPVPDVFGGGISEHD